MRPHRHHHLSDRELLLAIYEKLECVERSVGALVLGEGLIMATLDDLSTDIAEETTLIGSLGTFIQNLQDQINNAGGNQAKIDAIFAAAKTNKEALAALLVQNTPAANIPVS